MRRLNTLFAAALATASLALASGASAQAKTFTLESKSAIQFKAPKTALDPGFEGRGEGMTGEIVVDPAKAAKATGEVKFPIESINTGNETRNEHLRNDIWFDAKKFPNGVFKITSIEGITELKPNELVTGVVKGKLTVHGVTKDISAQAKIRYTPGSPGKLHVVASFPFVWRDYGVPTSSVASLAAKKIADELTINVDLYAIAK